MKHRSLTAAFALGLPLAVASTASAARNPFGDAPHLGDLINGRGCGAPEPTRRKWTPSARRSAATSRKGRVRDRPDQRSPSHVISNGNGRATCRSRSSTPRSRT